MLRDLAKGVNKGKGEIPTNKKTSLQKQTGFGLMYFILAEIKQVQIAGRGLGKGLLPYGLVVEASNFLAAPFIELFNFFIIAEACPVTEQPT